MTFFSLCVTIDYQTNQRADMPRITEVLQFKPTDKGWKFLEEMKKSDKSSYAQTVREAMNLLMEKKGY